MEVVGGSTQSWAAGTEILNLHIKIIPQGSSSCARVSLTCVTCLLKDYSANLVETDDDKLFKGLLPL